MRDYKVLKYSDSTAFAIDLYLCDVVRTSFLSSFRMKKRTTAFWRLSNHYSLSSTYSYKECVVIVIFVIPISFGEERSATAAQW